MGGFKMKIDTFDIYYKMNTALNNNKQFDPWDRDGKAKFAVVEELMKYTAMKLGVSQCGLTAEDLPLLLSHLDQVAEDKKKVLDSYTFFLLKQISNQQNFYIVWYETKEKETRQTPILKIKDDLKFDEFITHADNEPLHNTMVVLNKYINYDFKQKDNYPEQTLTLKKIK